jgi:hypothetical protein
MLELPQGNCCLLPPETYCWDPAVRGKGSGVTLPLRMLRMKGSCEDSPSIREPGQSVLATHCAPGAAAHTLLPHPTQGASASLPHCLSLFLCLFLSALSLSLISPVSVSPCLSACLISPFLSLSVSVFLSDSGFLALSLLLSF